MRVSVRFVVSAVVAAMVGMSGFAASGASASPTSGTRCPGRPSAPGYVRAENARPGSTGWMYSTTRNTGLQAYANVTSASCGDLVRLMVSTTARTASVTAWRMGYYNGRGGRAVFTSDSFPTRVQPAAVIDPATRSRRAPWTTSLALKIDSRFVPGSYVLKVADGRGGQTYVPLTVTDPASSTPLLVMSEPLTWQAYNTWGGISTYAGLNGSADRALAASLDRPYGKNHGAASYFTDEYPLIRLIEQNGLDAGYVTDVDINRDPDLLLAHRGVLLGAHAEYWSVSMRYAFDAARDAGVNLAVLGANTGYWQVRMTASRFGPDRGFVIYRDASLDTAAADVPQSSAIRFRDLPAAQPEAKLIGQEYEGCPGFSGDMVVTAPAWPFADLAAGAVLPLGVQQEFDRASTDLVPDNGYLQVLASSPIACNGGTTYANVTYYTSLSGAGVFSAGTIGWVCQLWGPDCGYGAGKTSATTRAVFTATTLRLLVGMAAGPLGESHPSTATGVPVAQAASVRAGTGPTSGNAEAGKAGGCPSHRKAAPSTGAAAVTVDSDDNDRDDGTLPALNGPGIGTLISWNASGPKV